MLGLKILVVEDEQSLDRVMSDAFRLIGIPAETVCSGREALERLKSQAYDLVVLDVRLPDMPGTEVLRQIRETTPHTAVIVMTAYAGGEEVEKALTYGVDALLFKPFEIDTLLSSAKQLLIRPASPAPAQLPQYAVVQMESETAVRSAKLRRLLQPNDLVTLHGMSAPTMGRVRKQDDHLLCIATPPVAETLPNRVQIEWSGSDALYRFRASMVEHTTDEEQSLLLLRQPQLIQRLQRRQFPRLPASGEVVVSDETRLRRTFEGRLVDLSEEGLGIEVPFEPRRGTLVALQGVWESPSEAHAFQVEAEVRYVIATNRERKPLYRLGLRTQQLPPALKEALRRAHREQLIGG